MALTKVGSIGIATGISLTGVTTTHSILSHSTAGIGITLSPDGHGYFTGIVTATSYRGDVSNCTGVGQTNFIDAESLSVSGISTLTGQATVGTGITLSPDGDVYATGVVTATKYYGDGSTLTNVSSTTINTNADNRVITGSGTANTLNGEANFTFDNSNGAILVSSSTGIGIGAATNGSAGYPSVTISGTSGGAIHFEDDGDLLADIYGSADGLTLTSRKTSDIIQFQTNSGSVTEKARFDSSGRLLIGTTTEGLGAGDNLTIADSADCGISIRSGTSSSGLVYFSDGTSGTAEYAGFIQYTHGTTNTMYLGANSATRLSIGPTGNTTITGICTAAAFVPSGGGQLSNRNIIINGDMTHWQRGTSGVNMSQNKYLVDRFKAMSSSDGEGAVSQHANVPTNAQTGGTTFASALRVNCTTVDSSLAADKYIIVSQRIEGQNLRHLGFGLAGTRYATLSFWQRSPTGTYHVSFRNANYNRYYIASYTTADNTYEKHEITIPIDTSGTWGSDHSMGLDITWSLGCGSNNSGGTVGSWSAGSKHAGSGNINFYSSTSNDFYITGVQFEAGSHATPYESLSYGEELLRCQRYCYNITAPPGFISSTEDLGAGFASSGTEIQFPLNFPVQMRATPSVEQVQGTEYFLLGQGNYGGNKFLSNNWIINNMAPHKGNLYTAPDTNLSSYIGQMGTVQSKNTAARLRLVSEM